MAKYDKKSRELAMLRRVYSKKEYPSIVHSDKPDFLLTGSDGSTFGVEVTEFYTTGSTARLKNLDTYFDELIKDKKFRHKEDIRNFTVDDFKIQTKDGVEKGTVPGVFMESMSLADKMTILNAMIADKNNKFGQYDSKLAHIELLIHDSDGLFGLAKPKEVGSILMHYMLPELIENSKFSDVLLVFDDNKREYVVSVLDNVFMGNVASAVGFVKEHRAELDNLLVDDVMPVDFVGAIFRHKDTKRYSPLISGSRGRIGRESKLTAQLFVLTKTEILCYRGSQKIIGSPPRPGTLPDGLPSKIAALYDSFMQKHTWADSIFKQDRKLPAPKARGKK